MSSRSQNKLVADLRCGVHRDEDGDRLLLSLRRKPVAEWSSRDALDYAGLVCQRDERFEFVVPLLLQADSREADWFIVEKALRVVKVAVQVEAQLARRWKNLLWSANPGPIVHELELSRLLIGTVEPRFDEWVRYGPSFEPYAVATFGPFFDRELARGWVFDRLNSR